MGHFGPKLTLGPSVVGLVVVMDAGTGVRESRLVYEQASMGTDALA
jgi:hypothetical protein